METQARPQFKETKKKLSMVMNKKVQPLLYNEFN